MKTADGVHICTPVVNCTSPIMARSFLREERLRAMPDHHGVAPERGPIYLGDAKKLRRYSESCKVIATINKGVKEI